MKYRFVMNVPGASEEQKQRGLAAALKVFTERDIDPAFAVVSHFDREGWDMRGFPEDDQPSDKAMDAADAWDEAQAAALAACCEGWASIPEDAGGLECRPVEPDKPKGA